MHRCVITCMAIYEYNYALGFAQYPCMCMYIHINYIIKDAGLGRPTTVIRDYDNTRMRYCACMDKNELTVM